MSKTISISNTSHEKLVKMKAMHSLNFIKLIDAMTDYFYSTKINPEEYKGIRNLFVSFIRQQEKDYLKGIKSRVHSNALGLAEINKKVSEIANDIDFISENMNS